MPYPGNCVGFAPALLSVLLMAACAGGQDERAAVLDEVDTAMRERYYDPTYGGMDWGALLNRHRANLLEAASDEQFYRGLNAMLFELGVSHIGVLPAEHPEWIGAPSAFSDGDVGLDARIIDDEIVITSVRAGSPAERAGVRPGHVIESIDGATLADLKREVLHNTPVSLLDRRTLFGLKVLEKFYGPTGDSVAIAYLDAQRRRHECMLTRVPRPGRTVFMDGIPPQYLEFETRRLAGGIGYIRFNAFNPDLLDRILDAVDGMDDNRGLIIDIRGNSGGAFGVRYELARHLVRGPGRCWRYRHRDRVEDVNVEPVPQAYSGPLAILVDEQSASSSEELAGAMQALGRAAIVGVRTPGIVLVADVVPLSSGDTFIIPIAQTETTNGTVLEGRGVIPDIEVMHDVQTLLDGRDAQLEAALDYLRGQ